MLLPVCVLLYGVFLTHSRGALLALLAMAVVAGRRRIGTVPALLLAAGLFAGAMALDFTGGRDISAESGSDRTDLWGGSMQLLKSHPLFGVGFGNFADYLGLTAHNSVMVCAAELGLFGLYFWSLFLFPREGRFGGCFAGEVSEGEPIVAEEGLFPQATRKIEAIDKAESQPSGAFDGFVAHRLSGRGWFLSRAFVMTFFLLGGMAEVVFELALRRGMIAPRLTLARVLLYAGGLAFSLGAGDVYPGPNL